MGRTEQYRIAVNEYATGKIPPGDPLWATYNDKFHNRELTVLDFANEVYTGHGYTTWHTGRRSIDNFQLGQHLAVDFDGAVEFDSLLAHPFVKTWGGLVHTTPSHTPDDPHCRVVFFLDEPITVASSYQAAAKLLVAMFPGADPSCTDASRFFFGSKNCQIEPLFNTLPLRTLRVYYRRFKHILDTSTGVGGQTAQNGSQTAQRANGAGSQRSLADVLLERALRKASVDGRNNTGLWLACQLRDNRFDRSQAETWMEAYHAAVQHGDHPYTMREMLASLRSAYTAQPREAWH